MLQLLKKSSFDDLWLRKTILIVPVSIMTSQSEIEASAKKGKACLEDLK